MSGRVERGRSVGAGAVVPTRNPDHPGAEESPPASAGRDAGERVGHHSMMRVTYGVIPSVRTGATLIGVPVS